MLEWANRGINLWKFDDVVWDSVGDGTGTTTLTHGVATYYLPVGTISVYDVALRERSGQSGQQDYKMTRIAGPVYLAIPNKLSQAKPLQYLIKRHEVQDVATGVDRKASITVWPVPESDGKYELVYWRMSRISDVGANADSTMEIPDRFLPALISGLAFHLAVKSQDPSTASRAQSFRAMYEADFGLASSEDTDKSDFRIVPRIFNV